MTLLQINKKRGCCQALWGDQCLSTNPSLHIMCFHGQINTGANKKIIPNRQMKLRGEWQCFISNITRSTRQLLFFYFSWIQSFCSRGEQTSELDYTGRKVPLTNKEVNSQAIKRTLAQWTTLNSVTTFNLTSSHGKKHSALSLIWMKPVYWHSGVPMQRPMAKKS